MSIFHPVHILCGQCGTRSPVLRSASLNADRRPDLRAAILDGSFQAEACPSCGAQLRVPPHMAFMELKRGWWILTEAAGQIEEWEAVELAGANTYARSFGAEAPEAAQEMGEGVRPRLVFGWPALREKLLCEDLALDDITLELVKMKVMRDVDGPPLADQTELRLVGGTAEALDLAWVVTETEERLAGLTLPRELYDEVAEDAEAWAELRARFEGVMFVDLRRFIAGPAVQQAAE